MQRWLWACSEVARLRTVAGIPCRSTWASDDVAMTSPTPWVIAAGASPTRAERVPMTS